MNWGAVSSVFVLAMFKFMFAAVPGAVVNIPFEQTYLALCAGGIVSSGVFYFSAELFMKISRNKRNKLILEAQLKGNQLKPKRKFTRMNKFIVRIKRKLGIFGISLFAPLFLSIPIGSIITAKFYGRKLITYPLIIAGIALNGVLITLLSYMFN